MVRNEHHEYIVSLQKSGRLGDITIPGFVPLQEFCSPIRLQHLSAGFVVLQKFLSPIRLQHLSVQCKQTLKCCNRIGLQNSCSGTNPGIVMSPNLLPFLRGGWALPN